MRKTNVNQSNQRLLISFLIRTKEGFELRKELKNILNKENIEFKLEENKTTTIFRLDNMYVKVYCDKYLPGKLEIVLYNKSEPEIYIAMLILTNSKPYILDDNTNGISFFTSIKKITKKSNINDVEINESVKTKIIGLNNIYKYQIIKTPRSNNNVTVKYIYKSSVLLSKSTISLVEIIIPVLFNQNSQVKEKVVTATFKNCEEVKL